MSQAPREQPDPPVGGDKSLASAAAFAIGNASQRIFTFLLLPVMTAVLSPAAYGRLGLLVMIQGGLTVALSVGVETGAFRHFFHLEGDDQSQRRFVLSMWKAVGLASFVLWALATIVLLLFVPSTDVLRPAEAALAVTGASVLIAGTIVPLTIMRAEQRLRDYILLTGITGISTAVLTVLFVVVLKLDVKGYFIGVLIANAIALATALLIFPWRRQRGFDREGVRKTTRIALPLVPHALSHWSLILLDRALLAVLVVPAALGLYTLASNLALPALILVVSLNQGFMPRYARAQKSADLSGLRDQISMQVALVVFIGLGTSLLAPVISHLSSSDYSGAAPLIPWLCLGYVFLGIYYIPMNAISLIAGRTDHIWMLTVTAAAANLAAIYVLVPPLGLTMAAVASAGGYLILLLLITAHAWRLGIRLSVDWVRTAGIAAMFSIAFAFGATFLPEASVAGFLERGLLVLAAGLCALPLLGMVPSALVGRARAALQI